MRKKRRIVLIIILCVIAAASLFLYFRMRSNSSSDTSSGSKSSSVSEEQNNSSNTSDSSDSSEASDEDTDTDTDTSSSDSSDNNSSSSDDPANYDPTENASSSSTVNAVKKKAVGTWTRTGIRYSDGSVQGDDTSCVYRFKSDGTYTANGKNADGKAYNKNGTWKVNSKKKIVLSNNVKLAFNDNGELLEYTGYRDGKGNRLYYVYTK
jgi:cytoskeletal protein RodZ